MDALLIIKRLQSGFKLSWHASVMNDNVWVFHISLCWLNSSVFPSNLEGCWHGLVVFLCDVEPSTDTDSLMLGSRIQVACQDLIW